MTHILKLVTAKVRQVFQKIINRAKQSADGWWKRLVAQSHSHFHFLSTSPIEFLQHSFFSHAAFHIPAGSSKLVFTSKGSLHHFLPVASLCLHPTPSWTCHLYSRTVSWWHFFYFIVLFFLQYLFSTRADFGNMVVSTAGFRFVWSRFNGWYAFHSHFWISDVDIWNSVRVVQWVVKEGGPLLAWLHSPMSLSSWGLGVWAYTHLLIRVYALYFAWAFIKRKCKQKCIFNPLKHGVSFFRPSQRGATETIRSLRQSEEGPFHGWAHTFKGN